MISVQDLKDKASRYYRLARSITSERDITLFESLGAEAEQAAADMEAAEAAQQNPPAPAEQSAGLTTKRSVVGA